MQSIYSILFLFLFCGCSTINQDTIHKNIDNIFSSVKEKTEKKVFAKQGDPVDIFSKGRLWDKYLIEYVNTIWRKLEGKTEGNQQQVYLLQTARIQAMSDLTSEIIITRGMLNMVNDEAELACLIGHEMGHRVQKVWEKKRSNWQGNLLSKVLNKLSIAPQLKDEITRQQADIYEHGWGKEIESEADRIGADLAAKAGYDPYALCDLFERLSKKVNADLFYRIRKLKGSHPALDERSISLRIYLISKGYIPHQGKRNSEDYHRIMQKLVGIHTQEYTQQTSKYQPQLNDITRLQEILKEIKEQTFYGKPLTIDQFTTIMSEIAQISQRSGISKEDLFVFNQTTYAHFMEEEIYQDESIWGKGDNYTQKIKEHIKEILAYTAQIGVGSVPVVGDAIDLYEILIGRDFYTGAELGASQRALSCLGVFIGSGKMWRETAAGIERELANEVVKKTARNTEEARKILKETVESFESGSDWKRLYSKTVNKGHINAPYWKGISAYETTLTKEKSFFRVHRANQEGSWLIDFDPAKMRSEELKKILSLRELPTKISRVTVPAGSRVRVGIAGEIDEWGKGGAIQWQIIKSEEKSFKDMGVVFKEAGDING